MRRLTSDLIVWHWQLSFRGPFRFTITVGRELAVGRGTYPPQS